MRSWLLLSLVITTLVATPALSQVWMEVGDAGDLPASAQIPAGSGPLVTIRGVLNANGDADMYCVNISDPAAFSASTCGGSSADTQLFLFDQQGLGITHDDDDPGGCGLQSTITGNACPFTAGSYLLTISQYNWDPLDPAGALIWANSPFGTERCPDGPGAPGPVAGWGATGFTEGDYSITLVGGEYCDGATPVLPTTWGRIKSSYK